MPEIACPGCKARYRVRESAAGKRTTCKKCGRQFRVPAAAVSVPKKTATTHPAVDAPPATPDSESWLADVEALADGHAIEPPPSVAPKTKAAGPAQRAAAFGHAGSAPGAAHTTPARVGAHGGGAYGRYLSAVGRSFLFLAKPMNILTFIGVWIVLAIGEVMKTAMAMAPLLTVPFLGFGAFIVAGWYMAFQINLVVAAAGEDERLPRMGAEDGVMGGVVFPFFQMLTARVFAFLPAGVYLVIVLLRVGAAAANNKGAVIAGASPVPAASTIAVLVVLTLAGYFVWPMLVLVVSCGGAISSMFRLDLLIATIVKSFPAYLLTVLAVNFTNGLKIVLTGIVLAGMSDKTNLMDDWTSVLVLPALFVGIGLFFDIIAMRSIGYYYCCFKHRFAWDWG